MRQGLFYLLVLFFISSKMQAQQTYSLTGLVFDEHLYPLTGATIYLNQGEKATITNEKGAFSITELENKLYLVQVSFLGYEPHVENYNPANQKQLKIILKHGFEQLEEVTIKDNYSHQRLKEVSGNIEIIDHQYIKKNLAGSLMQSLERLPGVSSIEIGSGQSKPVIRGLSFNRVVVSENGIKHEGQQWGADHGLEIDQYAVERVEIIKGPASLMYGSDAIGGVINLKQSFTPSVNTYGGTLETTFKSNNQAFETSAFAYGRKNNAYLKARITYVNYADYRVPVDIVNINGWNVPLTENKLRNTAGRENNFHLTTGIIKGKLNTQIIVSNIQAMSGFFANASGMEPRTADASYDVSNRDIMLPFQEINHFKIISKSQYYLKKGHLEAEFGYQNNLRQEMNKYIPHGFMDNDLPENLFASKTLEREFNKNTFSANLKHSEILYEKHHLSGGLSLEYQDNSIEGWSFIIPSFTMATGGVFVYEKMYVSKKMILHAGLRYDIGQLRTQEYTDWFASDVKHSLDTTKEYLLRSPDLLRRFNNASWAIGMNYNNPNFSVKANLGKSFRMPIAKELAANGVNYHLFRYEKGDSSLKAEESYQLDLGLEWNYKRFALQISPFVNYFPNYIYLNPSFEHDYQYGAGNQKFYYTQAAVFRYGSEAHIHYSITEQFKTGLIAEYLYSIQLSGEKKGFTLPFSPPASILFNLRYKPDLGKIFTEPELSVDFKFVARQDNVVPPEKNTASYHVINLSIGSNITFFKDEARINFQIKNLLNETYWNHTSYYRIIEVPEAGRSYIISIKIPFNNFKK